MFSLSESQCSLLNMEGPGQSIIVTDHRVELWESFNLKPSSERTLKQNKNSMITKAFLTVGESDI